MNLHTYGLMGQGNSINIRERSQQFLRERDPLGFLKHGRVRWTLFQCVKHVLYVAVPLAVFLYVLSSCLTGEVDQFIIKLAYDCFHCINV